MMIKVRHHGPGIHKSGTPQSVHGKGGMAKWKATEEENKKSESGPIRQIEDNSKVVDYALNIGGQVWKNEVRQDVADATDIRNTEFGDFWRDLTPVRKDALGHYAGSGYRDINALLRGAPPDDLRDVVNKPHRLERAQRYTAILDETLTHEMSTDTVVWRGVSGDVFGKLSKGGIVVDHGFVSTSLRHHAAKIFADETAGNILCRIVVKKGSKCGITTNPRNFDDEQEILLPRSQQFRVLGVREAGTGWSKRLLVDMETIA